jgi:hypothetical protein
MKNFITLLSLCICTNIYAHKDKTYKCDWHGKNVNVFNTMAADFRYTEKGMFYYLISNDSDYVYVDIRIFDDEIKKQIVREGLTIWIDPTGKKARNTGVRYPAGVQNNNITGGTSDKQLPDNMKSRIAADGHTDLSKQGDMPDSFTGSLMLYGFSESGPVLVNNFELNNFRGSVMVDKLRNMMYYEVTIPVSKWREIIARKSGKKKSASLMMGFSYESARSAVTGRPSGGAGKFHGGGHGMHGGGRGMDGGGGAMYGGGGGIHGGGSGGGGYRSGAGKESQTIFWLKDVSIARLK